MHTDSMPMHIHKHSNFTFADIIVYSHTMEFARLNYMSGWVINNHGI